MQCCPGTIRKDMLWSPSWSRILDVMGSCQSLAWQFANQRFCEQHGPWVGARLGRQQRSQRGKKVVRNEAHNAAIAEAIRRKWQDPGYQARIHDGRAKQSEALKSTREVANAAKAVTLSHQTMGFYTFLSSEHLQMPLQYQSMLNTYSSHLVAIMLVSLKYWKGALSIPSHLLEERWKITMIRAQEVCLPKWIFCTHLFWSGLCQAILPVAYLPVACLHPPLVAPQSLSCCFMDSSPACPEASFIYAEAQNGREG